jgi:hypothetical protein
MEWYWYYLIIGVYVAVSVYGNSVFYKIRHKEYVRVNGLVSWKIVYGFPFAIFAWWAIIFGACYEVMRNVHLEQKISTLKYGKKNEC